jgi:hypothetical protein
MLSWILQITIISIVLIFLVHYLFNFFKSTLTVPKIKDLVNAPAQKYENMFNIISKSNSEPILSANISANINTSSINNEYTLTDLLPKQETTSDMKNELKNFLKKQMNSTINVNNTTSITALDSMMSNSVSYSEFT